VDDRVSSEVVLALASFMVSVGNFNQSVALFQSLLAQSIANRGANPVPRSVKQNPVRTATKSGWHPFPQAARSAAVRKSRPYGRSQSSKGNASIDVMLDSAAANFVVDEHRDKKTIKRANSVSSASSTTSVLLRFFFGCRAFRCVNNRDRQLVRYKIHQPQRRTMRR
jgi:hypothetical protein